MHFDYGSPQVVSTCSFLATVLFVHDFPFFQFPVLFSDGMPNNNGSVPLNCSICASTFTERTAQLLANVEPSCRQVLLLTFPTLRPLCCFSACAFPPSLLWTPTYHAFRKRWDCHLIPQLQERRAKVELAFKIDSTQFFTLTEVPANAAMPSLYCMKTSSHR